MKFLKLLYRGWMKLAHAIGRVNTVILLTVVYIVIFGIAKLINLFSGKDMLESDLNPQRVSYWKKREDFQANKDAFLKPY